MRVNPRVGDELRVLVGRQHAGLAVYIRATVESVENGGVDVRLHTSSAQIKALDLIDVPSEVRAAVKQKPKAPRMILTGAPAERTPPLWRTPEQAQA